jgi:hypothetical protein
LTDLIETSGIVESDRSEEQLLRLFCGPNAEKFLQYLYEERDWNMVKAGVMKTPASIFFNRINFVALLFPVAWFFYRRMYLYGALIFLFPIVAGMLFPQFIKMLNFGVAIALAVIANQTYFYFARSRIARIEKRTDLSAQARDELIQKTGGVSIIGAILGAALTAAALSLIFLAVIQR